MSSYKLCQFSKLKQLESFQFSFPGESSDDGFLVKSNDKVYAYLNQCPHTGAPLNWQAHRFLNVQKDKILCTMHGALFNIETGLCEYGPCLGEHLKKLNTRINEDDVILETDG